MDKYEKVVDSTEQRMDRFRSRNADTDYRTLIAVESLHSITVEQTRYLASLQIATNNTLVRVATALETNNALLTALLRETCKKDDWATEWPDVLSTTAKN